MKASFRLFSITIVLAAACALESSILANAGRKLNQETSSGAAITIHPISKGGNTKTVKLPPGLSIVTPRSSKLRGRSNGVPKKPAATLTKTSSNSGSTFKKDNLHILSGHGGRGLQVPSSTSTERLFDFRRYIVNAVSSGEGDCQPTNPAFTIRGSTSNLQLVATEGSDCSRLSGGKFECVGAGRVMVDVVATNGLTDLTTGLSVTVDLFAPQETFSCTGNMGQAIAVDAVCPDSTWTSEDILCTPITNTVLVDDRTFCGNICSGGCTDGDFTDVEGYVLNPALCLWKPEDFSPPTEATSPPNTSVPSSETGSTESPSSCLDFQVLFTAGTSPDDNVLAIYEDGNPDNVVVYQSEFDANTQYSATTNDLCMDSEKCWEVLLIDSDGIQDGSLSVTANGQTKNVLAQPGTVCGDGCEAPATTFWKTHFGNCCMEMELNFTTDSSTDFTIVLFETNDLLEDESIDDPFLVGDTFDPDTEYGVTEEDLNKCLDPNACYALYISKAGSTTGFTGIGGVSFSVNGQVLLSSQAGSTDFVVDDDGNAVWLATFGLCA